MFEALCQDYIYKPVKACKEPLYPCGVFRDLLVYDKLHWFEFI